MNDAELLFFEKYPNALPLYEKLKERILDEIPGVQMKVQKTQISFINKHFFACVSFVKVRKVKDRPDPWLVVTFGLEYKVESSVCFTILILNSFRENTVRKRRNFWKREERVRS